MVGSAHGCTGSESVRLYCDLAAAIPVDDVRTARVSAAGSARAVIYVDGVGTARLVDTAGRRARGTVTDCLCCPVEPLTPIVAEHDSTTRCGKLAQNSGFFSYCSVYKNSEYYTGPEGNRKKPACCQMHSARVKDHHRPRSTRSTKSQLCCAKSEPPSKPGPT